MSELVNLRLARKRKARALAERIAAKRRLAFGRPKSELEHSRRERELERRRLDSKLISREEE